MDQSIEVGFILVADIVGKASSTFAKKNTISSASPAGSPTAFR